jgi:D-glycero-alpha-D-manno-heptose-7-phosphate kinase
MHAASDVPSRVRTRARTIVARAPARLDFGGGWTDVPPYSDEEGGCVCNLAVARYATVRVADDEHASTTFRAAGRHERMPVLATAALRRAGVRDARVDVWSDLPVSAGLGGSSAVGVALAAALAAWRNARQPDEIDDARRAELAEWSRGLEVDEVGIPGGRQDHYAAAFGGALRLDFGADAGGAPTRVTRLELSRTTLDALSRRCVVAYTGESRVSGETISAVLGAYRAGERRVVDALARMKAIAAEMAASLDAGRVDDLGRLLVEQWAHQRTLHPMIPTERIDEMIARATAAGALGAKALGASGGGCVLAIAAEGREAEVRAAVSALGEIVEVVPDVVGVTVEAR